ncbi:MAG TPA: chemotaxis protein CheB [Verrucomicrobiae bacterium]
MEKRDIVVMGASTGGIEALQVLVEDLPRDFAGAIFVVLHTAAQSPNFLGSILDQAGPLPAAIAKDREEIKPGRIYVAPADHHLVFDEKGLVRTTRGPKENRVRPAIDPLFRSAAHAYGPRVIGVVLTGLLDDGTAGLWAIKEQGGTAIVQNPEEAPAPSMPLSALKHVEVDHILNLTEIAPCLGKMVGTPPLKKGVRRVTKEMEAEVKIAREDSALANGILEWGEPSVYACPECHGVLMQLKEGSNFRFRCHTGHAYSVETLMAEFSEKSEETLWNAIRAIEELVILMNRMAQQFEEHNHGEAALALKKKADEAHERSEQVRAIVMHHKKVRESELSKSGKNEPAVKPD